MGFHLEFEGQKIVQIASESKSHTALIDSNDPSKLYEVYIWGDLGKKGSDIGARTVGKPILLDNMSNLPILQIACGSRFTVVLTDERQKSKIDFLGFFFLFH